MEIVILLVTSPTKLCFCFQGLPFPQDLQPFKILSGKQKGKNCIYVHLLFYLVDYERLKILHNESVEEARLKIYNKKTLSENRMEWSVHQASLFFRLQVYLFIYTQPDIKSLITTYYFYFYLVLIPD